MAEESDQSLLDAALSSFMKKNTKLARQLKAGIQSAEPSDLGLGIPVDFESAPGISVPMDDDWDSAMQNTFRRVAIGMAFHWDRTWDHREFTYRQPAEAVSVHDLPKLRDRIKELTQIPIRYRFGSLPHEKSSEPPVQQFTAWGFGFDVERRGVCMVAQLYKGRLLVLSIFVPKTDKVLQEQFMNSAAPLQPPPPPPAAPPARPA